MRLDPYTRPHPGALLLAACNLLGLVGLLVFDGAGDVASFVLAALPMAIGLRACVRMR
jgi:hypothetical protein